MIGINHWTRQWLESRQMRSRRPTIHQTRLQTMVLTPPQPYFQPVQILLFFPKQYLGLALAAQQRILKRQYAPFHLATWNGKNSLVQFYAPFFSRIKSTWCHLDFLSPPGSYSCCWILCGNNTTSRSPTDGRTWQPCSLINTESCVITNNRIISTSNHRFLAWLLIFTTRKTLTQLGCSSPEIKEFLSVFIWLHTGMSAQLMNMVMRQEVA